MTLARGWARGRLACAVASMAAAIAAGSSGPAADPNRAPGAAPRESRAYFETDIVPLFTRLGCNGGGCHGKATGQNGFKLSLLGYDPEFDYEALLKEARGRRLFPGDATRSLLWLKTTGVVPHGGGKRTEPGSRDSRVLAQWIEAGAPPRSPDDPIVERIAIFPERHVFGPGQTQQPLRVTAWLSDGTTRDVTDRAVYQSNEPEIADVNDSGVVQLGTRRGLFATMVRYGERIAVFHGTVPFHPAGAAPGQARSGATAQAAGGEPAAEGSPVLSPIDRHLRAQWRRLGIEPSAPATDGEFIRRATLDICGTLPSVAEVREYVADAQPDKRARLIDRLLERSEYARFFALKWADVLQNRGRGYSTSRQREGTTLFAGWVRDCFEKNMPYDEFATAILTAVGSQETDGPAVWYRTVRTLENYVESVSQAFLGVRVQCAQCHHHPAERWSQADYYSLAAVFARVGRKGGFADAEVPTNEVIFLAEEGEVLHPRTGEMMRPRPLGGPDFELSRYEDPRRRFAEWMTAPDNPFFARTMANRMWGHFFGRGIIHPIDDARSTNPPSNPELLDALAAEFVSSGYDVKRLIRLICNSEAYALSCLPNETNREDVQSFARFYPRRLPAEVLLDAFSQVLEAPTSFSSGRGEFPAGTRAIDLPDEAVPSHFLDVFGRPARSSACECERVDSPALGQALELVSSAEIQEKLTAPSAAPAKMAASDRPDAENVSELFLRLFARAPRDEELQTACRFLAESADRAEAWRSLFWSLLATNEFLFSH